MTTEDNCAGKPTAAAAKKQSALPHSIELINDARSIYGSRLIALVLFMMLLALTEGMGMALLLPLLSAIGVSSPNEDSGLTGLLHVGLNQLGASGSPQKIAFIIILVFAIQSICSVLQSWWVSWLQRSYCGHWQKRLLESLMYTEWNHFSEHKLGSLTSLITHDTNRLAAALFILMQVLTLSFTAVVYVIIALLISWEVTLLIVSVMLLLSVAVRGVGKEIYMIGGSIGPLTAKFNSLITEYLGGAKLIKSTSTENLAISRASILIDELQSQHRMAAFLPSLVRSILEFGSIVALCFILVAGNQLLDLRATNMLVVFALFVRLLPRFNSLQQSLHLLGNYLPALTEVRAVVEVAESKSERSRHRLEPDLAGYNEGSRLQVSIRKAGYGNKSIIKDFHLELPENGYFGIVGSSGSGKSTLINCIFGLNKIAEGDLFLGGRHIKDTPLNIWRGQIGYVPQDTILFNESIRANIAWAKPSATQDEIIAAAKQAMAHDFIMQTYAGYDSIVGEAGSRLSGGQRQRLGIARALLNSPKLLIMDEATSALDALSELYVLETIQNLRKKISILMVTHRLKAIETANLIVVMEHGRLAEMGTWQQLLERRQIFYRMATAKEIKNHGSLV